MENEKRNQIIIVSIILVLLLGVISFVIYSLFNTKKQNENKIDAKFQQIYSSDYKLSNLDNNYFIGTYSDKKKIDVIIDNTGTEIVKNTEDIFYDNLYKMKDGRYLIYNNIENILNTYVFDGTKIERKQHIQNVSYVKPILYVDNEIEYIIGFASLIENNLYLYDLNSEKPVILENKSIVGDYSTEGVYYTNNEEYLIVKDNDGLMGAVDFNGKQIIDYKYKNLVNTSNNSFIAVTTKDKYGVIDSLDKVLMKFEYNVIAPFKEYLLVVDSKNKMALYDNEYNNLTGFKMNYDSLLDYDFRNKVNSINLFLVEDKVLVVNNYMEFNNGTEYDKHNLYVIEKNKIVSNINQIGFGCSDVIYTVHKDSLIKIYNSNLDDIIEFEIDDVLKFEGIKKASDNIYEISYYNNKEELIKLYVDNNGDYVDFIYGENIITNDNYKVYYKEENDLSVLTIYNNDYEVLDELKGKYMNIFNDFIIVDNSIYKIVIK